MKQRLLSFLLALLPIVASADQSGNCGINLTWTYIESTNTLKIAGNGEMYNFESKSSAPWYDFNTKITNIIVENGVTTIGKAAFYGCTNLTIVIIPNSVTSIENGAFYGCSNLNSIIIPSSVITIGESAFFGCKNLNSITIPNSVISIGNSAFCGCSNLNSVTIPNNITTIGNTIFQYCTSLTSVTIPNSVTSIGVGAFYGCSSLSSLTIPKSVSSIANYAFYECGLMSAKILCCPTSIGSNIFGGDSCFKKVEFDCKKVTTLLKGVNSVETVILGENVSSIVNDAFSGCYRINSIFCLNPIPPICNGTNTFVCNNTGRDKYDIYTYATLHVPMGSKEVYSSAYEWRYFNKIKEDMEADGRVYYANLTVKQGTTGYTRQAVKAAETYTIYIGTLGENKVNAVTFNGKDVTDMVTNGYYITPEIKGESELSISYETATEVRSLTLNNVKVIGYDGEIIIKQIDEPSDVSVYSIDGKLVGNIPFAFGSINLPVPDEQLYIVKVGNRTYKIAL